LSGKVGRVLADDQAEVHVLRCRSVSRQCHKFSALRRLVPDPSQRRKSATLCRHGRPQGARNKLACLSASIPMMTRMPDGPSRDRGALRGRVSSSGSMRTENYPNRRAHPLNPRSRATPAASTAPRTGRGARQRNTGAPTDCWKKRPDPAGPTRTPSGRLGRQRVADLRC
jgi:hypothetical protein